MFGKSYIDLQTWNHVQISRKYNWKIHLIERVLFLTKLGCQSIVLIVVMVLVPNSISHHLFLIIVITKLQDS
jgi:hypothetical protein